ncbi:MAG: hypothetical protein J0H68_08015 [Sphingobacteriia bacterium]|nr:hypothetical protein [Sphingobacteriia bacterium]
MQPSLISLSQRLSILKKVESTNEFGTNISQLENITKLWGKIEPILDNKIVFSDGTSGVVHFELPYYRIIVRKNNLLRLGFFIKHKKLLFKICKILDLQNNFFLLIAQEVNSYE